MAPHLKKTSASQVHDSVIRRRAVMAIAPNFEIAALLFTLACAGFLHICASSL